MSSFSKLIAKRYLWTKRSEAFISLITISSVIGVALGVMVLCITMSIMSGFEHELKKKIVGSAHIYITSATKGIDEKGFISEIFKTQKDIEKISPYTEHQVLLQIGRHSRGLVLKGIREKTYKGKEVQGYLKQGVKLKDVLKPQINASALGNTNIDAIIIGKELQLQFGLSVGSVVTVLTPQLQSSPFGFMPRFKRFMVSAVYESGMSGYEESLAYISIEDAKSFFRMGKNEVSGFEIKLTDSKIAPSVARILATDIYAKHGSGIFVQDWSESNRELWEAIQLEKRVYFIVLLLLIVLASFSIVSSLVMIVMEKRKDIAVLKTLGARDKSIAKIFRIQGAVIGLIGTSSGLVLGVLGCLGLEAYGFPLPEKIFPTDTVPVKIELLNFFFVGIAAFTICYLSTWYPAKRASQVLPSEALRG